MRLDKPVKHLLIDLDGTLLGNRALPLSVDFVRRSIAALKPYADWRRAARTLFLINKEFVKPSSPDTNDIRVVALFSKAMNLSLEEGRKVLKEGVLAIFPTLHKHFYPMPGAKDFLEWAHGRYPLTLATNPVWPVEVIELRVKWAGIDPSIFSHVTHIRRMRACKPTREYYEQILADQGLDAKDCLLVGNDVKMDLAATKVGVRVFIVDKRAPGPKPLKINGGRAPAWSGRYSDLRAALEEQANQDLVSVN
jgi:FMN phosphatase YigB (HAD superfamily)